MECRGHHVVTLQHVIFICNTFAPRIGGIRGVAYLMLPWFGGSVFDVTLVRGQHRASPYEGFVEGSIFIIKVGGFDRGFYLSQQLKELIYSKG